MEWASTRGQAMITILNDRRQHSIGRAQVQQGDLWLAQDECEPVIVAVPAGTDLPEHRLRDGQLNVSAYWRDKRRPIRADSTNTIWALGASARERASALNSLQAPDFTLPDLDGKPHSLADTSYKGRARIISLFGTWCPNCNDEAKFLAELDERYGPRGLSIVGLAFELDTDFERSCRQVRRFQELHGIHYPILIAGESNKLKASKAFPALDRVRAYPTAIFLDANNKVRAVHTGFSGPATGPAHDHMRERYEALLETLLARD